MQLPRRDIHWKWSDVYISPQIRILLSKHFLVHRFNKRNTKRYCGICNIITCMQWFQTFLNRIFWWVFISKFLINRNLHFTMSMWQTQLLGALQQGSDVSELRRKALRSCDWSTWFFLRRNSPLIKETLFCYFWQCISI